MTLVGGMKVGDIENQVGRNSFAAQTFAIASFPINNFTANLVICINGAHLVVVLGGRIGAHQMSVVNFQAIPIKSGSIRNGIAITVASWIKVITIWVQSQQGKNRTNYCSVGESIDLNSFTGIVDKLQ